ncbi:MAG: dienelactone hydrolase [Actinomycetota bacterium]|nr:dienelactone hydrolase [Actinomycetota bacterium]
MGKPTAILLTPGAGGSSEHATLQAIESAVPVAVRRHDFAYRRAGKKAPPRAPKLIAELIEDLPSIAAAMGVDPRHMLIGGRSMGGRVCSMAVAEGLEVAGLVLLSYPLHPPGKPDTLRVDHFADIGVPCLFVSGDNDPFGSPEEFGAHLPTIRGEVTSLFLDGGRHDPKNKAQVAAIVEAVSSWVDTLG